MMNEDIKAVPCPFGDEWHIKRRIGQGSYGTVYLIERRDAGARIESAMKLIPVPASDEEVERLVQSGRQRDSLPRYYEEIAQAMLSEISLMSKVRGNSHIVSYEDHRVIKRASGLGADIYIRMEHLIPLQVYLAGRKVSFGDVTRLGVELCDALHTCSKYDMIHRDVKPDNIFVSENGDFKLGDFGVARRLEAAEGEGGARVGSLNYLAPEVKNGGTYDSRADLYSVGMVLYRMLNNGRAPFLPAPPQEYTRAQELRARERRFAGDALPPPARMLEPLWRIVQKACAFHPSQRYQTARDMRDALLAIVGLPDMLATLDVPDLPAQALTEEGERTSRRTPSENVNATGVRRDGVERAVIETDKQTDGDGQAPARKRGGWMLLAGIALLCVAVAVALAVRPRARARPGTVVAAVQETLADSLLLTWTGGQAPYQVDVSCADLRVASLPARERRLAVDNLAPNTRYTFHITDAKGASAVVSQKTAESPLYAAEAFTVLNMDAYICDRLDANVSGLPALIQADRAHRLGEAALSLRDARVDAQESCWLLLFLISGDTVTHSVPFTLVARFPDGFAVTDGDVITIEEGVKSYYWSLDALLTGAYDACGGWRAGDVALELYADGAFIGERRVAFAPAGGK